MPHKTEAPVITRDAWIEEGKRLFGDDMLQWKFKCPICGNVQSPEDFRQYKDRGADPGSAAVQCIGRFQGKPLRKAFGHNEKGTPKQPCDFAAYGLFSIGCRLVETGAEGPTNVFPFAEAAE